MPIEIRELVIRATVDPTGEGHADCCGSSSSRAGETPMSRPHAGADEDLVQNCVREVLRIIEDKRER